MNAADPVTSKPITKVTAKTFPSIFPSVVAPMSLLFAAGIGVRPGGNAALS